MSSDGDEVIGTTLGDVLLKVGRVLLVVLLLVLVLLFVFLI
jgi:hypothetical protein